MASDNVEEVMGRVADEFDVSTEELRDLNFRFATFLERKWLAGRHLIAEKGHDFNALGCGFIVFHRQLLDFTLRVIYASPNFKRLLAAGENDGTPTATRILSNQ